GGRSDPPRHERAASNPAGRLPATRPAGRGDRPALNQKPIGGRAAAAVPALTLCMPCHPHHFTRPFAALLSTASALLNDGAGRCAWWDASAPVQSLRTTC